MIPLLQDMKTEQNKLNNLAWEKDRKAHCVHFQLFLEVGLQAIYFSLFCFFIFSAFSLGHIYFLYSEKAIGGKAQRNSCSLCCSHLGTAEQFPDPA